MECSVLAGIGLSIVTALLPRVVSCEVVINHDETGKSGCKDRCVAGKYAGSQGKSKCSVCPPGKYEETTDGTSCAIAPMGHVPDDSETIFAKERLVINDLLL